VTSVVAVAYSWLWNF